MERRKMLIIAIVVLVTVSAGVSVFIVLNAGNGNGTDCETYSLDQCPVRCTVCPPCAECSSLRCATEEYCESIGFNRTWYETVKITPGG